MGMSAFKSLNFLAATFRNTYRELSRKLHLTSHRKDVEEFYLGVVKETLKYRKENPQDQKNGFMSLLIKMKDSGVLTFNQIAAQVVLYGKKDL